jgi:hypothetical protein
MDTAVNKEFIEIYTLQILSQLYNSLCDCRKVYSELENLVDPNFHLDDCPYKQELEKIDFKY